MRMTRIFLRLIFGVAILGCVVQCSWAQIQWESIPPKLREAFAAKPFGDLYDVSDRINPLYLRGDFDGDGTADYAILVVQIKTKKLGIAVWLSSRHQVVILGAGVPVQYGADRNDNLDFDRWRVTGTNAFDKSSSIELPAGFHGDAIFVEKTESASGIFYWKSGRFMWLQQGD